MNKIISVIINSIKILLNKPTAGRNKNPKIKPPNKPPKCPLNEIDGDNTSKIKLAINVDHKDADNE